MIQQPSFRVEPWALHETELHVELLAQSESLFALSNGHIGLRGNLEEGELAMAAGPKRVHAPEFTLRMGPGKDVGGSKGGDRVAEQETNR
jgi:hypothetical protein